MKKVFFYAVVVAFLMSGCYKDDIDDLNKKYDELRQEQERQAELLATYQTLLQAFENKLTITSAVEVEGGYKIVFSNGTEMLVKNGKDGKDGYQTPYIVSIVDVGGSIVFYMSDGNTITIGKTVTAGLWALSEGTMGRGNGQLGYFDYNAATDKFVRNDSKRFQNYGETPNDLLVYGSKMYCAITGTTDDGIVRVINPATGATIRDITVTFETVKQQPRRLAATKGKVYVTLYSGAVAQIDTVTFNVSVIGLGGTFSEGICAYEQSLYICNSGQGAENTVSVVDIATFAETETITVPYNPVNIISVGNGELYLNTATVWSGPAAGTPANVHVLNTATKTVTATFDVAVESIVAGKNYVYGTGFDWYEYEDTFVKISIANKSVSDLSDNSVFMSYKLSVNPLTGEVFQTQQMGQDIARFKEDGTYIETLDAGQQSGAALVFINTVKK